MKRATVGAFVILIFLSGCKGGGAGGTKGAGAGGDKTAGGEPRQDPRCPKGFVWIDKGSFAMGSPEADPNALPEEKPAFKAALRNPFCLARYETTQQQWLDVMGLRPAKFADCGLDCPVENVSWEQIQAFLNAYADKHHADVRLPTEQEWEYAARAGSTTRFYWGEDPKGGEVDDHAWHLGNSGRTTHPVGQKKPNAWGLHDMAGNVWEWVAGDFQPYPLKPEPDRKWGEGEMRRVARGGGWDNPPEYCRSAARVRNQGAGFPYFGFRMAADPK